jgi:hypothetical protein
MSWLFSQALVEAFSAGTSLDGEPCAQLNVMPTPHKFWCNGKTMEPSDLSRFGLTLRVLTEGRGLAVLTWFRAAFPARGLVQLDLELDSPTSEAGSGEKCAGSLAKFDRATSTWKTAHCSLLGDSGSSSVTWPRWGSMRNGECWERAKPVRHISASASGSSLPTPSGCRSGKNHVIGRMDEWGGSSNPWRGTEIGKTSSPAFEEWVMGWPEQWTALMPLGMDRFQQWQQQHGGF